MAGPKNAQPVRELDEVDRALLRELTRDGRATNAALAATVGIAESTCLARVRALRHAGVIAAIEARLDPAALGKPIEAVIKVRLTSHNPEQIRRFHAALRTIDGLIAAHHTAGADDYLLHVAVESPETLRSLILEQITVQPGVQSTETQLIFETIRGPGFL